MEENELYEYYPACGEADEIIDITMPAYQHEKYIAQAIESVLKQRTKYKYKLIIGDDKSTDNTRNIILEYQKNNPDKISVLLWKKNSFSMGLRNGLYLQKKCKAKYIATIEGDDFWISADKLERQIDFLENNPDFSGCTHNIVKVDDNNNFLHRNYTIFPYRYEHIYTKEDAKNFRLASQTASMVYRNFGADWSEEEWEKYSKCNANGDVKKCVLCGMHGDIYYMRDIMSAYRSVFDKGTSYTASLSKSKKLVQGYFNRRAITDYIYSEYGEKCYIEQLWADQWTGCKTRLMESFTLENFSNLLKMIREYFDLKKKYG